jgi:hypothetical protein
MKHPFRHGHFLLRGTVAFGLIVHIAFGASMRSTMDSLTAKLKWAESGKV